MAFESQLRQNQLDRTAFVQGLAEVYPGWRWQDPQGLVPAETEPEDTEREEPYPEMTPN